MNLLHPDTALTLMLVLSVFIPLISALLKWKSLPKELVGVLTLVIAALNGFITTWANDSDASHYDWKLALGTALFSLLIAIAAHFGVWNQTPQIQGKLLAFPKKSGTTPAVDEQKTA